MKIHLAALVAFALAFSTGTAEASRMFFSLSSTSPLVETSTSTNPTINMLVGQSASLYAWWQSTTETVNEGHGQVTQNERIAGWGHTIVDSNPILSRTSYSILNPIVFGTSRWDSIGNGPAPSGTFLVGGTSSSTNAVKFGGSNLGFGTTGQDSTYDPLSNTWLLSTLTFQATAPGTSQIRLGVGVSGITFENSPTIRGINFGFGDAAVQSNAFNTQSTIEDATVNVVPEPGTLVLLGMGLILFLAARLRRRAP